MLVAALLLALPPVPSPAPPADARTAVVLHEQCASRIDRRDLTLFANGTIRLREGPVGGERLTLREIGRPEVDAIRRRLADIDLASIESETGAPDGDWSMSCTLEVARDGVRHDFAYGHFDVGGLALDELRRVAGDLLEQARAEAYSAEIPLSYRARPGDRLERNDGLVFEVIGFTSDGKAIELAAVDQPIQLFVERDKLRLEFRRLLPPPEPF